MVYLLLKANKEAKNIINDFAPDLIVGTGGYACYPIIAQGSKMGIKTVLHESNVIPGVAVKMLQKKVDKIFVNFQKSQDAFSEKEKTVYTGNPLRNGFRLHDRVEARRILGIKEKYVILCYGGSLGAKRVNEGAIQLIENYIQYEPNILFIWATGKSDYENVIKILKEKHFDRLKNIKVSDYIYDMPEKISVADIVISRAGAMSISEMASSGKCAVFIPSPNVTDNHQYKNASLLAENMAAVVITEDCLYKLTDTVKDLISDERERKAMSEKIQNFYVKDANKRIYKEIKKLCHS
jgi:UDP-N-acetylglucosamine--N-acetylmuramyl-(pentapeptide) pyrophosphoryl-undecaprenol N-acetylglucosamine transferase